MQVKKSFQRLKMSENNINENVAGPITDANQYQGTGNKMFVSRRDNLIDADSIQMSAEIELGRVV